jgi:hypothetical protein
MAARLSEHAYEVQFRGSYIFCVFGPKLIPEFNTRWGPRLPNTYVYPTDNRWREPIGAPNIHVSASIFIARIT